MPNTNLPTNITSGTTGRIAQTNTVHAEVNELSRATGIRDLTSLLANGWIVMSSGFVRIERRRSHVYLYVRGLNGTDATSDRFLSAEDAIPVGFRPMGGVWRSQFAPDAALNPYFLTYEAGFLTAIGARRDLGGYIRVFEWRTTEAWPAVLPGSAVAG